MSHSIPKVGFVSLGCPKATVDSERILTHLRGEGYRIVPSYDDADLVVVNTCGFIDAAVEESLDTIGEALAENGRVIVTGCLGAREEVIRSAHPQVLAVTGPDSLQQVMDAVDLLVPMRQVRTADGDASSPADPVGQARKARQASCLRVDGESQVVTAGGLEAKALH